MAEKVQINFQTSIEDAAAIDLLARADGYDNRSAWVRAQLRSIINARRGEIATVTALPRLGVQDGAVVLVSADQAEQSQAA